MTTVIETDHLILRTWKDDDAEAYFYINKDPRVTEFLTGALTMEQVINFISVMNDQYDRLGYTLWAVELKETREMIGFIGLNDTSWQSHFTPAVEIGWRLGSQYWGRGYATEGAAACLEYGFNKMNLQEIVSFTVPANVRSIRVMERIRLKRDVNGDFAHPKLAADHPLSQHLLYRLKSSDYLQAAKQR